VTGDETSLTNRSDRAERRCIATALEGRKEGRATNVLTEKLSSKLLDDNRMQRQGATPARPGAGVCRVPARISHQPKIETLSLLVCCAG
jgi:hypothetical protein